jgi:hypothetical protein
MSEAKNWEFDAHDNTNSPLKLLKFAYSFSKSNKAELERDMIYSPIGMNDMDRHIFINFVITSTICTWKNVIIFNLILPDKKSLFQMFSL